MDYQLQEFVNNTDPMTLGMDQQLAFYQIKATMALERSVRSIDVTLVGDHGDPVQL